MGVLFITKVIFKSDWWVTEHGLTEIMDQVFDEIHKSNMSKDYNEGKLIKGKKYVKADIKKIFDESFKVRYEFYKDGKILELYSIHDLDDFVYVCRKCGLDIEFKMKQKKCPRCGNDDLWLHDIWR